VGYKSWTGCGHSDSGEEQALDQKTGKFQAVGRRNVKAALGKELNGEPAPCKRAFWKKDRWMPVTLGVSEVRQAIHRAHRGGWQTGGAARYWRILGVKKKKAGAPRSGQQSSNRPGQTV